MTSSERSLRARIAAQSRVAQGKADTSAARRAFLAKFEDYPDPDAALKAHMARLALKRLPRRAA